MNTEDRQLLATLTTRTRFAKFRQRFTPSPSPSISSFRIFGCIQAFFLLCFFPFSALVLLPTMLAGNNSKGHTRITTEGTCGENTKTVFSSMGLVVLVAHGACVCALVAMNLVFVVFVDVGDDTNNLTVGEVLLPNLLFFVFVLSHSVAFGFSTRSFGVGDFGEDTYFNADVAAANTVSTPTITNQTAIATTTTNNNLATTTTSPNNDDNSDSTSILFPNDNSDTDDELDYRKSQLEECHKSAHISTATTLTTATAATTATASAQREVSTLLQCVVNPCSELVHKWIKDVQWSIHVDLSTVQLRLFPPNAQQPAKDTQKMTVPTNNNNNNNNPKGHTISISTFLLSTIAPDATTLLCRTREQRNQFLFCYVIALLIALAPFAHALSHSRASIIVEMCRMFVVTFYLGSLLFMNLLCSQNFVFQARVMLRLRRALFLKTMRTSQRNAFNINATTNDECTLLHHNTLAFPVDCVNLRALVLTYKAFRQIFVTNNQHADAVLMAQFLIYVTSMLFQSAVTIVSAASPHSTADDSEAAAGVQSNNQFSMLVLFVAPAQVVLWALLLCRVILSGCDVSDEHASLSQHLLEHSLTTTQTTDHNTTAGDEISCAVDALDHLSEIDAPRVMGVQCSRVLVKTLLLLLVSFVTLVARAAH